MDRRLLKVECDHAQPRVVRPRLNFTLKGEDFLDGQLVGTWVNPITKKLQPIPNSEESDYQTSNAGRFKKIQLADGSPIDLNTPVLDFVEFKADEGLVGVKTVGNNTAGAGFVTSATFAAETGATVSAYAYSQGQDQGDVLIELFWANAATLAGGGVGIKAYSDGRVEVYKDSTSEPVWRGSFSGGGYQPGTVRGGSYGRPTDEYVTLRVESADGFLTITSSLSGIAQFKPDWGHDRYRDDGTLLAAAEPILPAKKFGWYVPKGAFAVVAAPVVYGYPSPYAISPVYSFAETPSPTPDPGDDAVDVLTGRVVPYSPDVTVTLLKADSLAGYDRTSKEFRAKVSFTGPAFVCGVVGSYPRITAPYQSDDGPKDLTPWVLSVSPFECQDGPDGAGFDLILRGDCPVPFIDETELRPIRLYLTAHPDDEDAPADVTLLDGVGDSPEWVDGFEPKAQSVRIRVWDRMRLVREARWRETVVFMGMPFCAPPGDPDLDGQESFVAMCLREGGVKDSELVDLPRIENEDGSLYAIDDTPPQIAGEWSFAGKVRQSPEDSLVEGWEMAPRYAWGLRPTVNGTRAYAVDTTADEAAVCAFYRLPEDAATDPGYAENELGGWPLLYGQPHRRTKLPKEGNVVRVVGRDPGSGRYLSAFVKQGASADPQAPDGPDKLGVPREVFRRLRALTTQAAVNAVARALDAAVSSRSYTHSWPAFMRFLDDGSPVWRGDTVTLKGANRDGSDAKIRVSGFSSMLADENGGGLMDGAGRVAPVSIRITDYSGGALCGLGGASAWQIARRQRERAQDGGVSIGFAEYLDTSMGRTNDLT